MKTHVEEELKILLASEKFALTCICSDQFAIREPFVVIDHKYFGIIPTDKIFEI